MMKREKQYSNKRITTLLLVLILTGFVNMDGQVLLSPPELFQNRDTIKPIDTLRTNLSFAIDSLMKIQDEFNQLEPIFNILNQLKDGKDTTLTIVHLGDSHVQAGHYSGRVMRLLHQQFGNAGRGWVAPFKLSRTNEPDDYFIRSSAKEWVSGKITQRQKRTPIGPGGIGIRTVSSSINFDIQITPNNGAGYEFNQVVLYRGDKSTPMLPAGTFKDSIETSRETDLLAPRLLMDTFRISRQTDLLQLHSTRRKPGTDILQPAGDFSNIYYGFNLTNGQPGVLYHSVGVNGAMYVNYTDADFMQRLALLKPNLLIVSLGTNESFGLRFNENQFRNQIHEFLQMVKKHIPRTIIILTTPAECYKRIRQNKQRVYVRNENIQKAAAAIVSQSKLEGVACWDLFSATGGRNSHKDWYQNKYLGRDRIHFTKGGYHEHSNLFFLALMRTMQKKEELRLKKLTNNGELD